MAWTQLKNAINNAIKANNNQEITGQVLNSVLNSIVNSVGKYATFAGNATPGTNPGAFEGPIVYFASTAGIYPNFGNITVNANQVVALYNINGSWESYEIANNAITTDRLVDRAVTTEKLADSVIQAIIFDVSAHNNGAVFESLSALLSSSNLSTLIPTSVRHGGITIRFIQGSEQSSDNKYVQYRSVAQSFTTTVSDWQKQGAEVIVSQNTETGHTDVTVGDTTTPVASVTDYEKSIQGTEIVDNTTTITNEYKNVYIPFKTGQHYLFRRTAGSSTQFNFIKPDGTYTDKLFNTNSDVDFVPEEDYIGYRTGVSGTTTVRVTTISINDKLDVLDDKLHVLDENLKALSIVTDGKVGIAFDNLIDKSEIQFGSGLSNNGNILRNDNWVNLYGLIFLQWRGQQYITINYVGASGGFYVWNFDKNMQPIVGSGIQGVEGTQTFERYNNDSKYIGVTLLDRGGSIQSKNIKANYGQTLTSDNTTPNPIKKYISSTESAIDNKVDIDYDNILDKSDIVNGSGYNDSGVLLTNSSWNNFYGSIVLPWRNEQYITINYAGASDGFYVVQFDKSGGFITGSAIKGVTGIQTFERYNNAESIGVTLLDAAGRLLDRPIRACYAQTLTDDTDAPNPISGYLKDIKGDIKELYSTTIIELYAYADGDSTLDDATHFYGWKNGKCAWQRAIDAADGKTRTIIYCKGVLNVTESNQFTRQADGFYNVVFIPFAKSNIELVGEGTDKTSLVVEMADDFTNYYTYQPMGIYGNNSLVKGMSIYGKNCRYCIHIDASGGTMANNHLIYLEDILCRHYNNAGGAYKTAFAACASDGMTITAERCTFIQENDDTSPIYTHDNVDYSKGGILKFKECKFMNSARAVEMALFQMLGSGTDNVIIYDNCDFTHCFPIMLCENNNNKSKSISKFVANNHYTIKGVTQSPIAYQTRSTSRSRVLRITSKTAGSSSSVRFDKTSSAFDVLIKGNYITGYTELTGVVHADGYQYRDGADVVSGFAMGELALDIDTNASIQKRLGDCSVNNKSLGVTIDGIDYTITFNQNYTSYSDADMLAVFTTVLGSVADVELYNWGEDYFPELQPSMTWGKNTSKEAILVGMGVMIRGGAVTKATSDDKVMGIALDNILPNCQGRIVRKAILSIYEDARHHICLETYPTRGTSDFYNYRGFFGIGSTPGVFVRKQAKAPLFGFEYGGWDNYLTIDL